MFPNPVRTALRPVYTVPFLRPVSSFAPPPAARPDCPAARQELIRLGNEGLPEGDPLYEKGAVEKLGRGIMK